MYNERDQLADQILQAASALYLKYGLKKVTMDDISKAIGKTRTAVYYYFKNREEVFDAVLDALVKEVVQEIQTAMNAQESIEAKIEAFCQTKIRTSEAKKPFFTAIEVGMNAAEKTKYTQAMAFVHQQLMQAERKMLSTALHESMQQQEIRQLTVTEEDNLIFILLSGIRGIKREMLLKNSFEGLNATIYTLVAMVDKWLK
ncbi:TetR/AcrR family transcriptional regulator [Sphingobacterium sp. HMA12]|uniref:TetR/AcrR family transcriptional regulator n=1 Tax=Sphingobacterium sp. HMA12 TaxID=2050894 RepID=UPI000CEA53EA|nr:TetR/AcrR family transcriptional regulator [Sphingobacterium sp. HMA12]